MCNNIRDSSERQEWQREGKEQHLVSFSSTLRSFYLGSWYLKTSVSGMPSENKTIVSSVRWGSQGQEMLQGSADGCRKPINLVCVFPDPSFS
ncbi:hypothetical protein JOQ06_011421 [Pogonophryne albipinna]|uniref:Uncharacterized protein n=1 Tax=Pogonophryne albipinna TaxID=1090488 RepID=A0AAD6FQG6_9TELE|nr:hypothetical protein JOQ06_011421 [Pogonophryne albipinna]